MVSLKEPKIKSLELRWAQTLHKSRQEKRTILISDGLSYCNTCLLVWILQYHNFRELDPQSSKSAVSARLSKKIQIEVNKVTYRSATAFASWGWLLPVNNFIELVAMPVSSKGSAITDEALWKITFSVLSVMGTKKKVDPSCLKKTGVFGLLQLLRLGWERKQTKQSKKSTQSTKLRNSILNQV